MASLFSDIKNFFDAKYSGRYLALILRELAKHEPQAFGQIFSLPKKYWPTEKNGLQLQYEWRFSHDEKNPRADLALLDGGRPILLVEIKEEDIINPKNNEQLERYISYIRTCQKNERPKLAYVSRYAPNDELLSAISRNSDVAFEVRFRKILDVLESSTSGVGAMVKDYLEDIGVSSYKVIDFDNDRAAITFLLVKMLGLPHSHGHGKLASDKAINSIPSIFEKLLGDLEVIGEWLKAANTDLFSNRLTRGFRPYPHYSESVLRKAQNSYDSPVGDADYGHVYFYTYGGLQKGNRKCVNVEVGYSFYIGKGKEESMSMRLYASFNWQGGEVEKSVEVKSFPAEKAALTKLRACLERALSEAKSKRKNLHQDVWIALHKFRLPPAG